jgi:non-ribosomal peptide synthetase-like protein
MLGILKAGAAYVPIDPSNPSDRVRYILSDCRTSAVVTHERWLAEIEDPSRAVLLDKHAEAIADQPDHAPACSDVAAAADGPAYVIYTSGTTGRPKGVPITHRNVCNLVRAEARIFAVPPQARVYQGFSVAFDASVEEIWLAFFAGATLVAATPEMAAAGPDLARMLTCARVTVLSCVPTLLAMMQEDITTLDLLIVGGEACPAHLVERWWRPHRRMMNTYGPTEATVIATYAELAPDRPVTIGRAVPNYYVFVLDEAMRKVPRLGEGELYIGGVGVARGYLNRPELTVHKFVPNPFVSECPDAPVLYRSGDLVRENEAGELEFLGRADTQVKLRGYRIELAEIESALLACSGVLGAVAAVREDVPGIQQLVGYVVPAPGATPDQDALRNALRQQLPPYMVPATIVTVPAFPTLTSGKVDRKRLPAPEERKSPRRDGVREPRTPTERALAATWQKLFPGVRVARDDNFFLTLGGHSLLAATMVSSLRTRRGFERLSMQAVYQHPTLAALAAHLDAQSQDAAGACVRPAVRASEHAYLAFCAAQVAALYVVFGFHALQWLAPFVTYGTLRAAGHGGTFAMLGALGSLLLVYPLMLVVGAATKWAVIGRYRHGSYPMYGLYHFRHWFVTQILDAVPVQYLRGSPMLAGFYRCLGAHIGRDVFLGADCLSAFDLITIGDGASLAAESSLKAATFEQGVLRIGAITIGPNARVGTRAVVADDVVMGANARLEDLSLLSRGSRADASTIYRGSPARPAGSAPSRLRAPRPGRARRAALAVGYLVASLALPAVPLAAMLPGILAMDAFEGAIGGYGLLAAPAVACGFIMLLALEIAAAKWLLLGRVRPGRYRLSSSFYLRKWFVDQLMELSLDVLGPVYGTLYSVPWYRLLGCKLGRHAELSTAVSTSPDLLEIDDQSFVADCVALGAPHVEGGYVTLRPTRVGKRAFLGNSAVVPAGHSVGDDCLIGVLSRTPLGDVTAAGTSWLGSPALELHQRAQSRAFPAETTYQPPRRLYALRLFVEFFRVTLPVSSFVVVTTVLLRLVAGARANLGWGATLALLPLFYVTAALGPVLFAVAAKWLLIGRYRAGEHPLWSGFVWTSELVTALYENIAAALLIELVLGTPLAPLCVRLFGARIGARVYLNTSELTEFDLVQVEDDAVLNQNCTLQTHLFEDRVMKMSSIAIGAGAVVGAGSIVLYDTHMAAGSGLDHLSLLMKGEGLPAHTRWRGTPASSATAPKTDPAAQAAAPAPAAAETGIAQPVLVNLRYGVSRS